MALFTASLFAVLLFLKSTTLSFAQTVTPAQDTGPVKSSQNWQCLSPGTSSKSGCTVNPDGESCNGTELPLTGHCDPANSDAYLVGCADTADGIKCSTGVDAYDEILNFGTKNVETLKNQFSVEFPSGAKTRSVDGNISTTVITHTPTGQERVVIGADGSKDTITERTFSFYCITTSPTVLTDPNGQGNTLQYGSFGFDGHAACLSVKTDPFGTVFDSQSLEPLPGVSVSLVNSTKNKLQLTGVVNPVTTVADGLFNFLVNSGTYYLLPSLPSGYSFSDQSYIHPNYTKAYSNLYKDGDAIVEQAGKPEHRDIALNPGVNAPLHSQPINMNYGTTQLGDVFKITGKQSHPLTIVSFHQGDKEIATTTADKYGFYEALVQNSLIDPAVMIDAYLTKVDLTKDQQTELPKKSIAIEPQLPYIEGRATTKTGIPIPNAQVKVKLKTSNKVAYQTSADGSGVFSVLPNNIPTLPFYLEFTPPNSSISTKMLTTEFAAVNKDYLATNNINLMTATKNGTLLISQNRNSQKPNGQDSPQTNNLPADNTAQQASAASNNALVISLVVFFIIFVIGAGLYIYMKQKNTNVDAIPQPPIPPTA